MVDFKVNHGQSQNYEEITFHIHKDILIIKKDNEKKYQEYEIIGVLKRGSRVVKWHRHCVKESFSFSYIFFIFIF